MSGNVWALVFIVVIAVALIVVIAVWQSLRSEQAATVARSATAHDDAYRTLAEEATTAARKSAEEQARITAELVEVRNRLAAIEKLLTDVG
jgi:hypothetical protein